MSIGAISSRIASIEARFATPDDTDLGTRVLGAAAEFDAFGEMYQQALEAVDATATGPVAKPFVNASMYGAYNPFVAMFGANGSESTGGYDLTTLLSALGGAAVLPGVSAMVPAPGAPTAEQITAAIEGRAGAPGIRPTSGYGAMPVPTEIAVYGNGRVPAAALQSLASQPNHRLAAPAAASFDRLVRAAAAEGIDVRITDSYRSYDQQVELADRKGLYSQGGLAATPGMSNHGWGLAVDFNVNDATTRNWLEVNAPRFGWVNAVHRENWHYEFRPNQV